VTGDWVGSRVNMDTVAEKNPYPLQEMNPGIWYTAGYITDWALLIHLYLHDT
jgi:hypothetical protein